MTIRVIGLLGLGKCSVHNYFEARERRKRYKTTIEVIGLGLGNCSAPITLLRLESGNGMNE